MRIIKIAFMREAEYKIKNERNSINMKNSERPHSNEGGPHPEIRRSADEAGLAAGALVVRADAANRYADASRRLNEAVSDADRLAAVLDMNDASIDSTEAASAESRMSWELRKMTNPDQD